MELDQFTDEQLLEGFADGREPCLEMLVTRHEDRIFALALRMMGNRADALEATQETFINLMRRGASFRGDSSFATWLYRIGINTCHDLLRQRRRLPIPDDSLRVPHTARIDEQAALRADLARALQSIPEDYREAVLLHDLGGFPYDEIARQANVPVGTVKSRISRGRKLLAQRLEQAGHVPASKPSSGRQTD